MQFQVVNIGGGANATAANITLQEVPEANPDGTPGVLQGQVSTLQLIVPVADAHDYAFGDKYDVTLTKVGA